MICQHCQFGREFCQRITQHLQFRRKSESIFINFAVKSDERGTSPNAVALTFLAKNMAFSLPCTSGSAGPSETFASPLLRRKNPLSPRRRSSSCASGRVYAKVSLGRACAEQFDRFSTGLQPRIRYGAGSAPVAGSNPCALVSIRGNVRITPCAADVVALPCTLAGDKPAPDTLP